MPVRGTDDLGWIIPEPACAGLPAFDILTALNIIFSRDLHSLTYVDAPRLRLDEFA